MKMRLILLFPLAFFALRGISTPHPLSTKAPTATTRKWTWARQALTPSYNTAEAGTIRSMPQVVPAKTGWSRMVEGGMILKHVEVAQKTITFASLPVLVMIPY